MKILIVNGTYRPEGTTTELARSFMEGAQAEGAEVDMIMLRTQTIGYCTNCLKCYGFAGAGIAPCSLKDDMDALIPRLVEADGILFASPVHNGFVTGLMTVFWERLAWRVLRPCEPIMKLCGMRTRVSSKIRALGSLAIAGGMPERLGKKFCNDGTRWLKGNATLILHGEWIGDMYAGADLERMPKSNQDWQRLFFLRRSSARQKQQAYALGVKMAQAIQSGRLTPVTMEKFFPLWLRWLMELIHTISPPYRIAG